MFNTCPRVSVLISTRDRPDDLRRCLDSLRTVSYANAEIMVVDQSADDMTFLVVEDFRSRLDKLVYHHIEGKGLSRARNYGIAKATGDIVIFLDDDCVVSEEWLHDTVSVFLRYPDAGLVYGSVVAAKHDPRKAHIPSFYPKIERKVRGWRAFVHLQGIGASMALRRTALQNVGLFDEALGAGADIFTGADEVDYACRLLVSGIGLVVTPLISVEHFGVRTLADGAATYLNAGYAYSSGAADMKFLRSGHPIALVLIASHGMYCLTRFNPLRWLNGQRTAGCEWIVMYLFGLAASFKYGVDRKSGLFVKRQAKQARGRRNTRRQNDQVCEP